ncbi:penicillin-binding transpeptidase domain-containing protein [Bacillus sp. V3B]|uniref:penicillin-binding transpeptidase domain-containing protein n=1 Tax=Bacillus sp. V3B TaxID=2804915 RepID=UPI00210CBB64|nr:penicillin-binding transpeptidase domain-containing protein [Bacillus sp. V3B]MCQ6274657.1 penicillin-binding transpeptidase domain-containing protein [Bacillus sp. V3B]
MKKSHIRFIGILLLFIGLLAGCNNESQPSDRLSQYIKLWNEQKFEDMYGLLTSTAQETVTKEEFVNRYEKIYKDLQISKLSVEFEKPEDEEKVEGETVSYPFSAEMDSLAGPITFDHQATLKKETQDDGENWYLDWNTTYIFPQLEQGDTIGLSAIPAKRGEIQDRSGKGMALNGNVYEVGIVPSGLGDQKEAIIEKVSDLLEISTESINQALDASWVQPDLFVPIKKLPLEEQELVASVTELDAVQSRQIPARVYPYKETGAHLVGYVGPITAEELEARKDKGYSSTDRIGKRGLEQVLDERLKGKNGVKITVNKEDHTAEVLAEKEVVHGENVQLTIDMNIQTKLQQELADQAGTAAAIHPQTGETLGLVSAPSFDPNILSLGATADVWAALEEDPQKPLLNRFSASYAPGSVIKPLTASIGLSEGAIDDQTTIQVDGLKWRKDSSWGNYYVTRVTDPKTAVDLEKALLYSDNIYFAQAALALGKDAFINGLKGFGFEEEIPYPYPLESSVTGSMDSELLVANSGYGQAETEMNILHLAATYTPFINEGTLLTPTLFLEGEKGKPWKENVMSAEQASKINTMLQKVVNDPRGTANKAKIEGLPLAGKTGTAELKEKQGERGNENGWFVAYNTENPSLLISMMVEEVQDKGGSTFVVEKVKNVFQQQ